MNLAAVMPLPEGMSELTFAGALGGHRIKMVRRGDGLPVHADTDFAICGTVIPDGDRTLMKPEGPFGDHLGYYSLEHPFPVLRVEKVYHRPDPIWAFTVVGRPTAGRHCIWGIDPRSNRPCDSFGIARRARRECR